MKGFQAGLAVCSVVVVLGAVPFEARAQDDPGSLAAAVAAGDVDINLRYRYEFVSQDGIDRNANASTVRLRLGYRTAEWSNGSAFVEFDYVGEAFVDRYNDGTGLDPGRRIYPAVADPAGPDLNQLYADYRPVPDLLLRLGRQRILSNNQRFIGAVGWRQNEQTFDAVSATYSGEAVTVRYAYVGQVNRIFGSRAGAGRHDVHAHLVDVTVNPGGPWSVAPYAYYLDNLDAPALSTSTLGARLQGQVALEVGSLSLVGEFARQTDAADAPVPFEAGYGHGAVDWNLPSGVSVGAGFERLGGDASEAGRALRTPLATLHAFDGWADQFLTTPDAGIDDLFIRAGARLASWQLSAVYHDFSAADDGGGYGTELDLSAGRRLDDRYDLLLKAALFDATEAPFRDTAKLWVMITAGF